MKIYRIPYIVISAVNGSNFQIEQQCPQCGAPIILDEADRILSCKFCRTRVFLATEDHFRFYLPPANGISENIFFIPYWRLKGLSYAIKAHSVSFRYFDANFLSFDCPQLPYSIGLRPQAMKLRFVGSNDNAGKFIMSSREIKKDLLNNFRTHGNAIQEVFIGETASVIYTPVYFSKGRLVDAILKKPFYLYNRETDIEANFTASPDEKWHVDFVPLLCPECGADLPGEKDALILFCGNCRRVWNPGGKHFSGVNVLTWEEQGDDVTYLPFWRLKVNVSGVKLESYADLIRVANLPKVPSDAWEQTPFYFSAPAFKVNPALFLRWCRQLTANPAAETLTADFLPKKIFRVTLPVTEAMESSVITLSSLMADKRHLAEMVETLTFSLEDYCLTLHPFRQSARELVHTKLAFSMDLSALTMGGYL